MTTLIIEIDDNKQQINIPHSWDDISIKTYRLLMTLNNDLSLITLRIKTISIILNIDEDIVRMIPTEDFIKIEEALQFITNTKINDEQNESIIINDEEYFCYNDFKNLTVGEQESINIIMDKYQHNILEGYNELLCILLRKKKDNGKLETFKSEMMNRADMFDNISINKINGLMFFFSNSNTI